MELRPGIRALWKKLMTTFKEQFLLDHGWIEEYPGQWHSEQNGDQRLTTSAAYAIQLELNKLEEQRKNKTLPRSKKKSRK